MMKVKQNKKVATKPKTKALNKACVSSSVCPYDDFACRVYEFCGTKKCSKRAEKLRQTDC